MKRPDWPAWAILLVTLLALFGALTAEGQEADFCAEFDLPQEQCDLWEESAAPGLTTAELTTRAGAGCPDLPTACASWAPALPCPYPGPNVSAAQQQAMAALVGPWVASTSPPPGMRSSYATVLDWWRDARSVPAREAIVRQYCRADAPTCGRGWTAWEAMGLIVKDCAGCPGGQPCWSWTGDHARSQQAYVDLYRLEPTLAQWLQIECHSRTGSGRWAANSILPKALDCVQRGGPPVADDPDPVDDPPDPVDPPDPPPPTCTPYAGSACEVRCEKVGKDRAWCLSPERETGARLLFDLCSGVCRGEAEEPDPEEPGDGLECWRVEGSARFVPGIPSTGRLEVELLRVDCPEGSP